MGTEKCFYYNNQKEEINYDDFEFPDDLKMIVEHLKDVGRITISIKEVEKKYREFCDDCWMAGWLSPNDSLLEEFADYLSKCEKAM